MDTATIDELQTAIETGYGELAGSRARTYGILGAVCGGLPGAEVVALFSGVESQTALLRRLPPGMRRGLQSMIRWVDENGCNPAQLVALESEFTRLFRGLGRTHSPPPPYESVYLDGGLVYGASTQSVAAVYRRFGVTGLNNEPADYLALELDFMRLLCDREALAWQDRHGMRELIAEESDFLSQHLAKWVPEFCQNIRRASTASFYTGFADAVEGWLKCDRRILKGLLKVESI